MALFLMQFIDILYTHHALSLGGYEGNPLMNYVLNVWGLSGIAYIKVVFLAIFLGFIGTISRHVYIRRFFYVATIIYCCLTVYHVVWYYWGV